MAMNTSYAVNKRYKDKVYRQMGLPLLKDDYVLLQQYAQSQGQSMSEVIKRLLMREIPGFRGFKEEVPGSEVKP